MKHLVWDNDSVSLADSLAKEEEDKSFEELLEEANELVETYLGDEKINLEDKIPLGDSIVLVGEIVRWNGPKNAYKKLNASNIGDAIVEMANIFDWSDNSIEIYVEDGRLYMSQKGHDNPVSPTIVEARAYNSEDEDKIEDLLYEYISDNTKSLDKLIAETSPIGSEIAEVYGW